MNLFSDLVSPAIAGRPMLLKNLSAWNKRKQIGLGGCLMEAAEGQWVHDAHLGPGGMVGDGTVPSISRRTFSNWIVLSVGAIGFLSAARRLSAQSLAGKWQGTRSERNAITGGTYTANFQFEFYGNGTFQQVVRLGSSVILRLTGQYSLINGRKQGDPSVTHILALAPQSIEVRPDDKELKLLQLADLPNVESTEQFVFFYNLAPAGAMTLQNRAGGETWGLKRVVE